MPFDEKLQTLLRRRGLSARALAHELGVSNSTVAGWLKSSRPQAAQAKQLADFFEVSVDELVDDAKPLPPTIPFRRHLGAVQDTRHKVEEAYPDNPEAQREAFDSLEWQRVFAEREAQITAERKSLAAQLRAMADDLDPPEEVASRRRASMQAKMDEAERLVREKQRERRQSAARGKSA
jgi:transcriptional regulator with XRE-family HTH domain